MSGRTRSYDTELQMFVDSVREPNSGHLRFLRWLVEHDLLEHGAAGAPSGQYAAVLHPELLLVR